MPEPAFDRPPAAVLLDRETLLARVDRIRQFARGGRRALHKPLLLLYALARLKHDRQTEITFKASFRAPASAIGVAFDRVFRTMLVLPCAPNGARDLDCATCGMVSGAESC
jgi:hypothetical protein